MHEVLLYILVGSAVGLVLVHEITEHIGKEVAKTSQEFFGALQKGITTSVLEGLQVMGTIVAREVKETLPNALASKANEKTAAQGLAQMRQSAIAKLVESLNPEDWSQAQRLLVQSGAADPADFLPLAFQFWKHGHVDKAIEVCELGMTKSPRSARSNSRTALHIILPSKAIPRMPTAPANLQSKPAKNLPNSDRGH